MAWIKTGRSIRIIWTVSVILWAETLALPCDWSTGSGKLTPYISEAPATASSTNNAALCKTLCVNQTSFICAAVNYKDGECQLLTENKDTATVEEADGWEYFIRPLCAGIWLPWRAQKGKYITEGTSTDFQTVNNLEECMTGCLRDQTEDSACNAINMHVTDARCKLRSKRVGGDMVTATSNPDWQYFNRPSWYLESSRGTSSAEIYDKGIIGYYLHIFTEVKIPASGYLVAWQYYLKKEYCTSYAAIWRRFASNNYTLISRTLLIPEDSTKPGVRFQFIQTEVIRVKQGDLLSIHTQAAECGYNRVSVDPDEGGTTISTPGYLNININQTMNYVHGINYAAYRKASPALRAYVSEYLSIDGRPTPQHNSSLSEGQKWLRLPSLPTTEESAAVAGYKLMCSVDAQMVNLVNCYKDLAPVTAENVLLSLPDVKRQYYASLQIARNFNGLELLEGNLSVSSAFCTGRNLSQEVNVTEQESPTENSDYVVSVTVLNTFQNDYCAKSLKLSYPDYDGEYVDIVPGQETVLNVTLMKGTTYQLTVQLRLADDAESTFWTQRYGDTSAATTKPSAGIVAAAVVASTVLLATILIVLVVLYRRGKLFHRSEERPQVQRPNGFQSTATASSPTSGNVMVESGADESSRRTIKSLIATKPRSGSNSKLLSPEGSPTYENSTRILVDRLHHVIREEKQRCPDNPFRDEFNTLSHFELPFDEGRTPENALKNRFKNITAFNKTRVKLRVTPKNPTDYINACYIKDYEGKVRFVASQGPKDSTVVDMWRLIHCTKAKVVVMVTNTVEAGKMKCSPYWPEANTAMFGEYKVTLLEVTTFCFYTIRKMEYSIDNERGIVTQCHYTEWYDQDIPSAAGLLSFRARVKQETGFSTAPVIVHCSAGVGRTGTYIALENLIQEAHDSRMRERSVDIAACVNRLRQQRMFMVQVPEQYLFLYEMVSEALSCGDTSLPCETFSQTLSRWREVGAGGISVLVDQFRKLMQTSKPIPDEMYRTAANKENAHKNRDPKVLPLSSRCVTVNQPERDRTGYINAVYCNGYQQKSGFITTQIPLKSTVCEYWRMIMEQRSAIVIYLNDCLSTSYLPQQGETVQAGRIQVTCVQYTPRNGALTEVVLECRDKHMVQNVTIIEVKLRGENLPTSTQLVSLCQRAERYATSGSDVITIQCRNGCRLSGLFLIAMNLYMRTRIEHEVDIVLEVKLARLSRAQFISTQQEFDVLYEFLECYLSEFKDYSNFSKI